MAEQVTEASTSPQKRVRLRPETHSKLAAIVAQTRWNEGVVLDVLCDEYMANHGISVTDATVPPNGSKIAQPANESLQTDQSPAPQGSDMTSDDEAGPHSPPASSQPRSDANPAGARRQAS